MRISNFAVTNQRGVRLASCEAVPRIMIITGPNGCGKSTLLNALRTSYTDVGHTIYISPHRNSRRQTVRMRFLGQNRIMMSSLLSENNLPGFEGLNIPSHERDAWNFDEAQSYLKYSLCQIEIDRQAAITQRYDATGAVQRSDIPDLWSPLRELARNLLPHLQFHRIDLSNRDEIKCLWHVHSKNISVDIDDLSSGEKAVIQMFFPLIEHQISERLALMRGISEQTSQNQVAVLMDEPELHLHPNLQAKVLDYIRGLSLREGVQFILATHSPSMVEQATNEELYLLRPAELTDSNENQLIRIADDEEHLMALRNLFGSTSNITALKKILVVEGRAADKDSRRPSDERIYGFLSDQFGQLTVLSGGGKSECHKLLESLNKLLLPLAPHLKAVALLDQDTQSTDPKYTNVVYLPVSMIENLLIDPDVIFRATETVRHKTSFQNVGDVTSAIDEILDDMYKHEVGRRFKSTLSSFTFRITDPIDDARRQVEEFASSLLDKLSPEYFDTIKQDAAQSVETLKVQSKRREFYDGKKIIDQFYKNHMSETGMSKEIFTYTCAKEASSRTSVSSFIMALFESLGFAST